MTFISQFCQFSYLVLSLALPPRRLPQRHELETASVLILLHSFLIPVLLIPLPLGSQLELPDPTLPPRLALRWLSPLPLRSAHLRPVLVVVDADRPRVRVAVPRTYAEGSSKRDMSFAGCMFSPRPDVASGDCGASVALPHRVPLPEPAALGGRGSRIRPGGGGGPWRAATAIDCKGKHV